MRLKDTVVKTSQHLPDIGPLLFIFSLQYFIVQIIVGHQFLPSYSVAYNTISDLGNTSCNGLVCSPYHTLMNGSFIVLGLTMIGGAAAFVWRTSASRTTQIGYGMFALGGAGTILVGLFPENTIPLLHGIGATLPFLVGNGGLVLLSRSSTASVGLRNFTVICGGVGLIALGLYEANVYLGIGQGGMERLVAYPQTVWMIVWGAYEFFWKGSSKSA